MWIAFAILSSLSLGLFDIFKKLSLERNNMFVVLLANVAIYSLIVSPLLVLGLRGDASCSLPSDGHPLMFVKAAIVTFSWLLGYASIRHLPLSVSGSINALRPLLVMLGGVLIFCERPNWLQWVGIAVGVASMVLVWRVGRREEREKSNTRWMVYAMLSVVFWAISGLYDKYLLMSYTPLAIEAWYPVYQTAIMLVVTPIALRTGGGGAPFRWTWSIVAISVFIALADITYFYAISEPGSLISIAAMIRRSSAFVSFLFAMIILSERNLRMKLVDLALLVLSLSLLIAGSLMDV